MRVLLLYDDEQCLGFNDYSARRRSTSCAAVARAWCGRRRNRVLSKNVFPRNCTSPTFKRHRAVVTYFSLRREIAIPQGVRKHGGAVVAPTEGRLRKFNRIHRIFTIAHSRPFSFVLFLSKSVRSFHLLLRSHITHVKFSDSPSR